ncbi:hypothetical protein Droror1_Dr00006631 [Drosera rotundifolia]
MTIAKYSRQAKMGLFKLVRQAKRPHGLCVKMGAVVVLGLCFVLVWSFFSSTPDSLVTQRGSFDEIGKPVSGITKPGVDDSRSQSVKHRPQEHHVGGDSKSGKVESKSKGEKSKEKGDEGVSLAASEHKSKGDGKSRGGQGKEDSDRSKSGKVLNRKKDGLHWDGIGAKSLEKEAEKDTEEEESEEEEVVVDGNEDGIESGANEDDDDDLDTVVDEGADGKVNDGVDVESGKKGKKDKKLGPLFDPKAHYNWKLCNVRSKHNYIPCIDVESAGKVQSYRHHERRCPRVPPMCLVPLPSEGYGTPVRWPDSKLKILHKNVAHPKLAAYAKTQSWILEAEEFLLFPQNQSKSNGGVAQYLDSIEEMVPDIEWGKNVHVVLDIGCTDSAFAAFLLEKDVLTLTLGLKDDLVDLTQIALERGFPAVVTPLAARRLPYPSGVFDAIHCGECNINWHANGGKLLLEMNRILRPGGYFLLSSKHNIIEKEEAMTAFTASICWNVLADKTNEDSEVGVKIYQKPEFNDIYELRRKKNPPMCMEKENPDAAWYVPIRSCLHPIPAALEQHGTEWPAEWPKRLESYPDWLVDKEKVRQDTEHWKAVVEKSYLTGMGIDWANIRNVMDMKAIYGGFAAALSQQKVWVMNVVPVHAPNTLPYIFERGLVGTYHDWCESFGTYPRSYDLLHVDHLFARLKNRCRHPVGILVEMDRILRPGGWVIIRDKVEILEPVEVILRSLNWDIRMTFSQHKEGIICAQKSTWRPS